MCFSPKSEDPLRPMKLLIPDRGLEDALARIDNPVTKNLDAPPEPVVSDYLQVTYLAMFFLIGTPINVAAYFDLRQHARRIAHSRMSTVYLLKKHLNLSDLLVIMVYTPSQIIWLLTYSWIGGQAMCKIVKFAQNLSFQISSNIIVCIALDRLISILPRKPSAIRFPRRSISGKQRGKIFLTCAWILAVAFSCPLLITYTVFEPFSQWQQCVTIWQEANFHATDLGQNVSTSTSPMERQSVLFNRLELAYGAFNLLCMFWIPLFFVVLCYIAILFILKYKVPGGAAHEKLEQNETTDLKLLRDTSKFEEQRRLKPAPPVLMLQNPTEEEKPEYDTSGSLVESPSMSSSPHDPRRQKRSAMRISVFLILAYIGCWLPYNILSLWEFLHRDSYLHYSEKLDFVHGLVVLNSVINPFIYGMFGRYVREV